MVFWSSFAKKIKQSVSQVSFDLLKTRVSNVETKNQQQDTQINNINSTLQTNSTNIVNLNNVKADKTALEVVDNKVDGVINGLQNGNIVNYTGTWSSSTTYNIAQAVTFNNKWYVSNVNNNVNHTPTGSSDAYWELLSEPTINLNPYLTKSEANSTYATINTTNSISSRVSSAETSITNLTNNKADRSYVDNNFYNKQKINSFNLTTITGKITNISVPPQNLGVGNYGIIKMAFDTDINVNPVDWNEFAVIDFYFPNAVRNKTWMKPTFVNLVNNSKLGIEFFTPDANSYVNQVGTRVAVRIIKNENYIG